jgi:hypothetical protein
MTTAKEYVEKYTELGNKYKALETKHKNLRACVSGMTQQLRELEGPYDEELECTTAWPQVSSFGIYMQLLQALMGAVPPVVGGETDTTIAIKEQKYTDRKKKFKVLD